MFSYDNGVLADALWEELAETNKKVVDLRSQLAVAVKTIEMLQAQNEDLRAVADQEEPVELKP
jgi:regulator of replication initiation timing